MRLKHLVLQGYKSFADKTDFEFPSGITAIVGPNGTGKSNIADAIRWALGERSMSTLRAKSTADMIFAGGESRARAGMAEVSLTFDNADGGLPIEFTEVTISRRAYRSGENEYLINGSQVLLRDIEELLAQSSLSERTYTVIGQGLVDAALALSAQERRALFEEAAGISLYRDRREKTIARLDETERNLERVYDIVSEVAPRLRRLRRDAAQVEQHRRLTAHLERLQRTWYGHRWGQQQQKLERALERASNLDAWLAELQGQATVLNERLAEVRQREGVLRGQLRDWYRESADLHETVDDARRQVAVSEERERLLRTRREELLGEIEPLRMQREEQSRAVAGLERHVVDLKRDLVGRSQTLAEVEREASDKERRAEGRQQARARVERELRGHRARLERLDGELLEAREAISRLVSQQAVAEERARQFESRRQEALAQLEPLGARQGDQAQRVADGRARLAQLERRLERRRQHLSDLEREADEGAPEAGEWAERRAAVAQQLREGQEQAARLDKSLGEARQESAELAGELKALERVRAAGAAYDRGVQVLLEAELDGVLGPLATLIQVPPEWERAIEAALGGDLQAVVIEREARVPQIHSLLERHGGRLILLPLDVRRSRSSGGPLPREALSAARIVACEERVRPVVDALLGAVALCDDFEQASALLPHMPPRGRCVTRTGVVLRDDGAFVVGSARAGGLLAAERARRELPARLEQVRGRLEELEGRREAEGTRVASLAARLEEIDRRTAHAREAARRRYQERVGEARTAIAVAEETLRSQRAALKREEAELARLRAQRQNLRRQADQLAARHAAQMEQARVFRLAVSHIEGGEEGGAQPGPAHADGPAPGQAYGPDAVLDPQAEQLRERLWDAYRRCDEIEEQQRAASRRVSSLEKRLERLTQQAAAAREEATRFEREQLATARTEVALAEASLRSQQQALERETVLLERLRSQVDARRERAEELRAEREQLLERIAALREEASRLGAQLRQVRDRIQPAEDELEGLDQAATSLERRRRQAQKRVRAAEERHGRAELEVERKRDELRLLAQRIQEDLGLVELELSESVTAQAPLPMRPLVSELPVVELLPEGLEGEMQFLKKRLRRLGAVNPNAPDELAEVQERHGFLTEQAADLRAATEQLRHTVSELDTLMEHAFQDTFEAVAGHFSAMFSDLFEGGEAHLTLTDPYDLLNTGVEIMARPPGKRAQRLALLSGGERALTAVALLFSLLHISATPFCVLDEVDAMLDEANVGRFRVKLEGLARGTQFIIITHNRSTVESADAVYGVSMGSNAVSRVVSLKLEEAGDR